MRVAELIKRLQEFPPEFEVVCVNSIGWESDVDIVRQYWVPNQVALEPKENHESRSN